MKRTSWLMVVVSLLLSIVLISCGYVKKDELEKQLSDQKTDMDQKIQLAQDTATVASDKADKALTATKRIESIKDEILSDVDERIDTAMVAAKGDVVKEQEEVKRVAEEAANKALADAKTAAIAEDEKVKQVAKEAADKAMSAAMEAARKAQEAAREAEIAKQLPVVSEPLVFAVYFDPGKIKLKPEGIAELEKAAAAIKDNPGASIKVEGHADNTPVVYSKWGDNWVLSQARAQAVKDYLVEQLGAPAESIKQTVGFSFYKPTASNAKKDRWQNRRVEVIVTP